MMYAPGRCAYAVILKEHLEEPQDRPHADLGHTAIFKEGKYVKAVDPNRSKALRYFRNEMGNGTTSIKLSEEDGWTAIERLGTETKMTPRLEGESLVVDVEVSIKGNINEWHSEKKINEETYRQVEEAVSHTVKKNMEALLEVVRSEPITDVINIGVEVHRQMPGYWQSVKENWDDAFKNAQINISVDTELINYNLIERTSIPEEEDIGGPRKSIFPWKN